MEEDQLQRLPDGDEMADNEQRLGARLLSEGWREVAAYRATVDEIDVPGRPNYVRLCISHEGQTQIRLFPRSRLAEVKAAFPGAEIECRIYASGPNRVSTLRYVGPSKEELLAAQPETLSDKEIKALETIDVTDEG